MSNVKVKSIISRKVKIDADSRNGQWRQCVRVASAAPCPLDGRYRGQ